MPYGRRNFAAYQRSGSPAAALPSTKSLASYRNKISVILLVTSVYTAFLYQRGGASKFLGTTEGGQTTTMLPAGRRLTVATWNIAAINNNPFEYWITYDENPKYEKLMIDVESFLESPGDRDVKVDQVFSQDMFNKLDSRMEAVGWKSVRTYWEKEFQDRNIISGFMKDKTLGSKRLASMPDRITNTINLDGGGQAYRPTVINMYAEDLSTMGKWWEAWEKFMFDDKLPIKGKSGVVEDKIPYQMLQPIKKAKYPRITEQEEADSLPLQTMCGAIFDAILVHMMNTVSTPSEWQELKKVMVENLNKKKVPRTMEILETTYIDSDVITLQEVSSSFIDQARASKLGQKFHIVAPKDLDAVRDQNSVICLNKRTFPDGMGVEISSLVSDAFPAGVAVPVAKGDILAITATSKKGTQFLIASFHGDTNGLATKPVLDAVVKVLESDSELAGHQLIFGMDANTYEHAKPGEQQDVVDFGRDYVSHGLTSCWGDVPNPANYTTFNARTYLQPQLNKACKISEKRKNGDVNPKDFILFPKSSFSVVRTWKDNTGRKEYIEGTAFPTLEFPSDHGILSTIIEPTKATS